ncbi:hypothetical protein G3V71_23965, partial [Escherichia coli]|nr:hypothetical protein [Escherichia coli]
GEIVRAALLNVDYRCERIFHLNGQTCLLQPERAMGIWSKFSSFHAQKKIEFPLPFDSTDQTSAYIFDWLQTQWNDMDSAVRFSWEWNRKTEQEQNRWLGTIVTRWNELNDLMRAVSCVTALLEGERWILCHIDTHNHAPEL